MILEHLSIVNFKNIQEAELDLSSKLNCFVGLNGAGKTNVLDAIYYLSFCKSAFNSIDSQNVRHNADFFLVQGNYRNADATESISCGLKIDHKKVVKRNGKVYSRLSEHIGHIPLVLVSPNDIELILGGSEERRSFMDMIISQYDATYLHEVIRYRRALQQRNLLLKQDSVDADFIAIYEEEMALSGEVIYAIREQFVDEFEIIFQQIFSNLASSSEKVSLEYMSNCEKGSILSLIQQNRTKDELMGFSLIGVHRDDLRMSLGGYPIKKEGSQGQNKTFLISLKLAQFEFLRRRNGQTPILLLDDIFDKLDSSRVGNILKLVSQDVYGQIFITDTDRSLISDLIARTGMDSRIFEVVEGEIKDEIQ